MPYVDENDVKYYLVPGAPVRDAQGNLVTNRSGGQYYPTTGSAANPLPLREVQSKAPLTEVVVGGRGFTSDLYVAIPDGNEPEVLVDWNDDEIPPQVVSASVAEIKASLAADVQGIVDDAVASATAGLPGNVDALTVTVTELDLRAVKSKTGFEVTGIAVIGGTRGLPTQSEAGMLYFLLPSGS